MSIHSCEYGTVAIAYVAYQITNEWCENCLHQGSDSNNDTNCKLRCSFQTGLQYKLIET